MPKKSKESSFSDEWSQIYIQCDSLLLFKCKLNRLC